MKYLSITNITALQPLLDFDIKGVNIDLHNDFDCIEINDNTKKLEFLFKRTIGNEFYKEQNAILIFNDIVECNFQFLKENERLGDMKTLMNFAKGEFSEDHKFCHNSDIKYFFLEFLESERIEILCKEAIIFLW